MHLSPAIAVLVLTLSPTCILARPTKTVPQQDQKRDLTEDLLDDLSSLPLVWQQASTCDLSSVTMPLSEASTPSTLPAVSSGLTLSHVAVGRGTQNYTCAGASPSSTPTALGAVATLFNATCLAATSPSLLASMPGIALTYDVPSATSALQAYDMLLSGHHYFTNSSTPFFNLDTAGHDYGMMAGEKSDSADAPAGSTEGAEGEKAVAWLKITSRDEEGMAFREVYRLQTAGGSAPSTCGNLSGEFEVQYAATYWLWS